MALVGERVRPRYQPDLLERLAPHPPLAAVKPPQSTPSAKCIVVAPFSNSAVRDWPLDRYKRLIGLLLNEVDTYVVLVGSRDQAAKLAAVVPGLWQ